MSLDVGVVGIAAVGGDADDDVDVDVDGVGGGGDCVSGREAGER